MTSLYQKHRQKWINCERCELHRHRSKVVLVRGSLPCNVLFIGEAPGASEDVLGQPFVGPAGKLLGRMVDSASEGMELSLAYTNLLGCIPKDEDGNKIANGNDIPKEYIDTCAVRVDELFSIASPEKVVCVGKLAAKHSNHDLTIDHPAFILRLDVSQQGLAIQRCVVSLRDLFETVPPF